MTEVSFTPKSSILHRKRHLQWLSYLALGSILNAAVWGLVFFYLKVTPTTYTSNWGVRIVAEDDAEVNITLPDVGTASKSGGDAPKVVPSRDLRSDYIYIVTRPDVIEEAAQKVSMSPKEFGEPRVQTDRGSIIIAFEMDGASPTLAQKKSLALYQAMTEKIEDLREVELERKQQNVRGTLEAARQRLNEAQSKLAQYQAGSSLKSDEQITNLSVSIEELRRTNSELVAQGQGVSNRLKQLSGDVDLSQEAADAYILQADEVFQQLSQAYSQTNTELTNSLSRLTPNNPQVISKRAALEQTANALKERGELILGKPVSLETLVRLKSLTLDPKVRIAREDLYKNVVTSKATEQELIGQNRELDRQIDQLEGRLNTLTQERFTLASLRRDAQIAEAIFTSTLARLDLGEGNIYSIYPPIQMVAAPTLPDLDEPTSPERKKVLLGGAAGSFLVTTGIVLFWLEKRRPKKKAAVSDPLSYT